MSPSQDDERPAGNGLEDEGSAGNALDDERLLDALLADAREAPRPEDLGRVEHRLQDWLAPGAAPPVRPSTRSLRSRALKPLLVVIGAGLITQVFLDGVAPGVSGSPQETAATTAPVLAPPAPVAAPAVVPHASVSVADLPEAPESAPSVPTRPSQVSAPSIANGPGLAASGNGPGSLEANRAEANDVAESEASFLRRTRATLASDPARALRMTEEHVSRFPQGVLAQERDVIAIDALVRLGARDEARSRASAFHTRYPRSAHAGRVAAIVGTETP